MNEQLFDHKYSHAERRHVDVLLPATQSASSGRGGTHKATAETRQR